MPLRIEPHAEPIPGYRLIERLGGGGFGEVWKAEVPGGLFKAIKFVYGEISSDDSVSLGDDPDGARAKQELKSLNRMKTVNHPYILSLERYEIIQGQLVIVMELADKTLWDRFKECRAQGLSGIPREELLSYMEETAEALDLMNSQFQLQHLDIKPQNIFLVFNHVKIADFGLVKDLANKQNATITGGVTPVYAAPETFDGWLSRQSDQYSLAIVYQELLIGQRPFAGSTMKQLILHHLQSAPDLTLLPMADRPITARALAKNPEDRYPTCTEFVRLLRQATSNKPSSHENKGKNSAATATPTPSDTTFTAPARGSVGPVKPEDPNFSTSKGFYANRPQILPPRPEAPAGNGTGDSLTPSSDPLKKQGSAPGAGSKKALPSPQELLGVLQPGLVIGLGRMGVETLVHLRRRLGEEYGSGETVPQLRMLGIDTDSDTIQQATNDVGQVGLQSQEVFLTRLQRPSYYIKSRDGKLPTDSWLNPKLLYRIPREQINASAGLRALGRLAFVDNYRAIAKRIEVELLACALPQTLHDFSPYSTLGVRSSTPRVYIATSLMGSTGSGMFLDVAYLVRKLLRQQGHEDAEIVGLFYVPTVRRDASLAPALMNTYASLIELNHFSLPESLFMARYETAASSNKDSLTETGPAFHRCLMLSLPDSKGKVNGVDNSPTINMVGDFLYRDLTTQLGSTIDEQRRKKWSLSNEWQMGKGPLLQSLSTYCIHWPRRILLERCARRLCAQLVVRWMNKDAKAIADTIRQWTQERWETLGMRADQLIERFQKLTEHQLQQTPEQVLTEVLGPLRESILGDGKEVKTISMGPVVQAMDRLEKAIGSPEESRTAATMHVEPSTLERALTDIAHVIADECEQKLAELAVTLLEDPNYRLAGAEEALRQFCSTVEQSLQSQETLAKELTEKATQLHQRIIQLIETPMQSSSPANTTWKLTLTRRTAAGKNAPTANDVFDLVRMYAKSRYHSLVLTYLNRLYVSLRGHLSDQIREVGFCRQRLGELHGMLQPPTDVRRDRKQESTAERVLYPAGCLEMNDAIERIAQSITLEDLLRFDEQVQSWIKKHCQALLQVCMGTSAMVKNLAPVMIQEAEVYLRERLEGASVADMYLARKRVEDQEAPDDIIVDDLQRCHDEAAPDLGRLSDANEISIVCLPNDDHGKELQQIIKQHLPDLEILMTDRQDEMVFYREIINIPWKDLEQLGPIAQEAYERRTSSDPSSPHSREDILEWHAPLAAAKR